MYPQTNLKLKFSTLETVVLFWRSLGWKFYILVDIFSFYKTEIFSHRNIYFEKFDFNVHFIGNCLSIRSKTFVGISMEIYMKVVINLYDIFGNNLEIYGNFWKSLEKFLIIYMKSLSSFYLFSSFIKKKRWKIKYCLVCHLWKFWKLL